VTVEAKTVLPIKQPSTQSGGLSMQSTPPAVDFSVFWYAYSTIAQTLAGAFGFLVAVVLFRLQTLDSQWIAAAEEMIKALTGQLDRGRFRWLIRERNITQFLSEYSVELTKYEAKNSGNQNHAKSISGMVGEMRRYLQTRDDIRKALKWSLWMSTAAIIMCFLFLPLTTRTITYGLLPHQERTALLCSYIVLAVTTVLAVGCIVSYFNLAMTAVVMPAKKAT
jgi:hypothetical protein